MMSRFAGSPALVFLTILSFATFAWSQQMEDMERERKTRDFEQVVDTRIAGIAARARALLEQAERAIRLAPLQAQCDKPITPVDYDVVLAELKVALESSTSRLTQDRRVYDERLREYEAYTRSDSQKIDMYYALRLQQMHALGSQSRVRNIAAIAKSYGDTMPEVAAKVGFAVCLIRAMDGTEAESLSSALVSLHRDYREMLYIVQR